MQRVNFSGLPLLRVNFLFWVLGSVGFVLYVCVSVAQNCPFPWQFQTLNPKDSNPSPLHVNDHKGAGFELNPEAQTVQAALLELATSKMMSTRKPASITSSFCQKAQ